MGRNRGESLVFRYEKKWAGEGRFFGKKLLKYLSAILVIQVVWEKTRLLHLLFTLFSGFRKSCPWWKTSANHRSFQKESAPILPLHKWKYACQSLWKVKVWFNGGKSCRKSCYSSIETERVPVIFKYPKVDTGGNKAWDIHMCTKMIEVDAHQAT